MNYALPEQRLARELAPGECLLWSGRPRQGIFLRPSDACVIPFSLLWGGFAIFWEAAVITTKAPWIFKLWGIPFVVVGLYFMVGRFFVDARLREKTIYGLTSSRVIITSGLFRETIQSLALRSLSDYSLSERPDGSGSIVLGTPSRQAMFANSG